MIDLGKFYGFGGFSSFGEVVNIIVRLGFMFAIIIILFFLLFAGFRYLTSGGNKEETAKARAMITNSIIGLLLLMFIFLGLQFIFQFFNLEEFSIF